MSEAAAKASLARVSNNVPNCVVAVDGGYEGATSEEKTMTFWRTDASGKWVKDGQASSMPGVSTGSGDTIETSIDGKKFSGASHAIFILHRFFGGTGSSPTLQVFAKGPSQWGALTSDGDSRLRVDTGRHDWDATVAAWADAKFEGDLLKLGSFVIRNTTATGWTEWQGWRAQGDSFIRVGPVEKPPEASDYGTMQDAVFVSPTGQNACHMDDRTVTCMIHADNVGTPNGENAVKLDANGTALVLGDLNDVDSAADVGSWADSGDSVPPTKNGMYVLPYGKSISNSYTKCVSATSGFTCSNDVASFTVNSQGLQRTGERAD